MSTHSTDGRSWAKLSELKPGDKLIADGGFTCMRDGAIKVVLAEPNGELYVFCDGPDGEGGLEEGKCHHNLKGQISQENHDSLVGLWRESYIRRPDQSGRKRGGGNSRRGRFARREGTERWR